MSSELFGTDGIRGPAGVYPLDQITLRKIGLAVGTYFAESGQTVLIGWDPRESSLDIAEALTKGLIDAGVQVKKIGVIPTPGLAYITGCQDDIAAGVMITASHNPYTDNGVKVFTPEGTKLSDSQQSDLNALIMKDIVGRKGGSAADAPELIRQYEDFLVESATGRTLGGFKVALDMANGATSGLAAKVFERLGAEVSTLFDAPDGRNINQSCGATNAAALQDFVTENKLDAGAAFDGDGDRLVLVDSRGRALSGDHILYILAVAGNQPGVVATIMSNVGLDTALEEHGIKLIRTDVGDRAVLEGMRTSGHTLGGEQSGHIVIARYSYTGDGILSAIQALLLVQESGKDLATWYDELKLLPQALISISLPDIRLLQTADVREFIREQEELIGNSGRLNIRPSGTEPKVRIMVEAPDAETKVRGIADKLSSIIKTEESDIHG